MKVELLVARSGPTINQNVGEQITVGEDEGKRLIEAGQAVAVKESGRSKKGVETASVGPEETR